MGRAARGAPGSPSRVPCPRCPKVTEPRFLCPPQMLMPKKNRIAIYELLFKEGVMVAKKDVHMPKHPELVDKNVPNLHVMKAMQVWGLGGHRGQGLGATGVRV